MKGYTESGFEWEISDDVLNDWETLELLGEADEGKVSSLVKGIKRIFGEDGYDAFKEHIRKNNKDGKVPADTFKDELLEFMQSTKIGKNS